MANTFSEFHCVCVCDVRSPLAGSEWMQVVVRFIIVVVRYEHSGAKSLQDSMEKNIYGFMGTSHSIYRKLVRFRFNTFSKCDAFVLSRIHKCAQAAEVLREIYVAFTIRFSSIRLLIRIWTCIKSRNFIGNQNMCINAVYMCLLSLSLSAHISSAAAEHHSKCKQYI